MIRVLDSVPKQCFQPLIPLNVSNGSLALQIGIFSVSVQKILGPKRIWSKIIYYPKKFGPKNIGSENIMGQIFFVQKSFGSKKFVGQKMLGPKNF